MLKPKTDFSSVLRAAVLVGLAPFVLLACAALGLAEPRDFNDRASYAYDAAEQGVGTVRAMLAADQLSPDDAGNAIDQLANYKRAVDVARDLYAVSAADGEARLAGIRAGLDGLIEYLQQKGGGYDDEN